MKHAACKSFLLLGCEHQHCEETVTKKYGIFESDVIHSPSTCSLQSFFSFDGWLIRGCFCRALCPRRSWEFKSQLLQNTSIIKYTYTHRGRCCISPVSCSCLDVQAPGGNHLQRRHLSSFSQPRDSATHSSSYHLMKRLLPCDTFHYRSKSTYLYEEDHLPVDPWSPLPANKPICIDRLSWR